ncbi:SAM-dependent methyltransferase [Brumimicrobium glaciale]|uniref:SAM-dependent methyltransferase n=1 Tax=Brumimicrobium glaciale TaxID=200475 RepID=A0A4Q4KV19_9FLAO|nr:tRNA (5-methylaminomethyl-2-thiouridine)(34)-methyltransferase MnmD [Brumimicrobium glaciale]RYM35974.1 SAM-dependent methyltransferase [Brumimicrobium glaciale]
MKREIITTKDGSKTIYMPDIYEHYHSNHGALQEALHVFIKSGWDEIKTKEVSVLEIGFGTGLNTIITVIAGQNDNKTVHYTGLEAFPVTLEDIELLKYDELEYIAPFSESYQKLHTAKWDEFVAISESFTLKKVEQKMEDYIPEKESFDLIYYDAFGPRAQPFMWTTEVLQKMYDALSTNGIFVTYCAKGDVRRSLISLGFEVEKIPGPPGKREMLRARKI